MLQQEHAAQPVVVLVAAHKPYFMPADGCYLPVWAGAALRGPAPAGWQPDDTGENISARNETYCELTALYWGWKNLPPQAQYVGLAHYRRHFGRPGAFGRPETRIADSACLRAQLEKAPVLLPRPRQYWIETNYSQYVHAHHAADLAATRRILAAHWPAYLPASDAVMRRTGGHRFNLFVMRRDLLDAWCTWLFDVLFRLEAELDLSGYSANDRRVFGFVAERLLDVWLEAAGTAWTELPVVNLESQHWPAKIAAFLRRKIQGGRP